jgi:hypothetical protein
VEYKYWLQFCDAANPEDPSIPIRSNWTIPPSETPITTEVLATTSTQVDESSVVEPPRKKARIIDPGAGSSTQTASPEKNKKINKKLIESAIEADRTSTTPPITCEPL